MTKVTLTTEEIDAAFEGVEHQQDYVVNIYKLVYPMWDEILFIDGWPRSSKKLWKEICKRAQEFDKAVHPTVMPGGLWLNKGFSAIGENENIELGEMEVIVAPYVLEEQIVLSE